MDREQNRMPARIGFRNWERSIRERGDGRMKEMRKWIAVLLMAALLAPLFAVPSVQAAEEKAEKKVSEEPVQATVEEAEEEEKQPVVYQLDEENKDEQGIVYTIYEESGVACVGTDSWAEHNNSGYEGANSGRVILPDFVEREGESYEVTEIGPNAFSNNPYILHLVVSDTVLSIYNNAFSRSTLQSIYLGKGLFGFDFNSSFFEVENLKQIEVDKENKWYEVQDGILYDKRNGELLLVPKKKQFTQKYQLPEGVKRIGDGAFQGIYDSGLNTVLLPDSVEEIEPYAFSTSHIQGINLEHVKSIGRGAFQNTTLTSVVIGRETYLDGRGDYDEGKGKNFSNCYRLRCVDHKNPQLVESEFEECSRLDMVLLAEDTMEIPARAFYKCENLKDIVIPPSVKWIDKTAFYGCNDLVIYGEKGSAAEQFASECLFEFSAIDQCDHDEVELTAWEDEYVLVTGSCCRKCNYKKRTCIEKGTLQTGTSENRLGHFQAEKLVSTKNETVTLNASQKDSYGLYYELNLVEQTAALDGIDNSSYKGKGGGRVVVPSYVSYQGATYKVKEIRGGVCDSHLLNMLIIPDTVTDIVGGPFSNCDLLNEIYLGKEVKDLSKSGFCSNRSIINFQISKENPYLCLENGVVYNKEKTKLIRRLPQVRQNYFVVPEGVQTIGKFAFYRSEIDAVYLPESVKTLEGLAFWDSGIRYINCDQVQYCDYSAFDDCIKLRSISLKNVKQFNSPNGIHGIWSCPKLQSAYIGGDLTIGEADLWDCPQLRSIVIDGSIHYKASIYSENADDWVNTFPKLKHLILPAGMESLSNRWTVSSPNLKKLYVPDSVTQIEENEKDPGRNMTWYTASGSAASVYAEENGIKWVDTSAHSHQLKEMVFYEDAYASVKGQYCEECAYGTDLRYETTMKGTYPNNGRTPDMQGMSESEPEPLDEEGKDRYGIPYILDEETLTAVAGDGRKGSFQYDGNMGTAVVLPSYVESGGSVYEVKELADYLFYENPNLVQLSIPDSCQKIGKDVLAYSTLQKLKLGSELCSIAGDTLGPLPDLIQIEVSEENEHWIVENGILYNSDQTLLVCCPPVQKGTLSVPECVTAISDYAFYQSEYERIRLNTGLRNIGERAFYASSLTGIELIGTEETLVIGKEAFWNCGELQWCWLKGRIQFAELNGDSFSGCDKFRTLFCFDYQSVRSYYQNSPFFLPFKISLL